MPRPERPVNPEDGPIARFAVELRALRERAGSPGYRELARRAHYSQTTLAQAARGENLPSLAVTRAYVRACGGDEAEWETRWREIAVAPDPCPPPAAAPMERAPYVGLSAYGPEDAEWFRGRDKLVATVVDRVARQRFVAVVGPSGAGKSSVLRAGLLPSVSALLITPGAHPLRECAVRLGALLGVPADELAADFDEAPRNLGLAIRQLVATREESTECVLVVDQIEEVFTLCRDETERDRFIAALLDTAYDADSRARVVVGLRADFYAHCVRYPRLAEALQDAQVLVGPMSTEELTQAITQPAVRAGLMIEKTLVSAVVHDAADRPGALPFVSHVLWETWRRRHGNGLFLESYLAAGGVNGAVAQTADRLYDDLDERQRHTARGIFLRLTALGEGTEDTRRRVATDELLDSPDREDVTEVLTRLAAARLVTLGADSVEVAHEALIRSWPRLRSWLAEDREAVLAHRRLTTAAVDWARHDRDEGLLYRGARLATWQDRPPERLNDVERAFLTASRHAAEREQRSRRRRVRWTMGGLATATAVVTVLAVVALMMATRAVDERALAVGRQLVADARAQLQIDPELALLLAREAYATAPNDDTEAVLRQALADSHVRATLPSFGSEVTGVTFSPDGKLLVTTYLDGAVRVWNWDAEHGARTSQRRMLSAGKPYPAYSPSFSRDGRHIATVDAIGDVSLWDWETVDRGGRVNPVTLRYHDNPNAILSGRATVTFSWDGQRVARGGEDDVIVIWDVGADTQPDVIRVHDAVRDSIGEQPQLGIRTLSFSPDGTRLASGGPDGVVRVWALAGGGNPVIPYRHKDSVEAVAFSPDGHHVATAGADGTVGVWNLTDPTDSAVLGSHANGVHGIAYSEDGRWLVSGSSGGTVRIWDASQRAASIVLRGHHGPVRAVAFSPDGSSVASAGDDGTAKVWTIDEIENLAVFRGHDGPVTSVATTSDGRHLASGGQDGTIRLWDTGGDREPIARQGAATPVTQVTFSPDGRYLASTDELGSAFVWDADNLTKLVDLNKDTPVYPTRVSFSADSRRIVAAGSGSLWIRDITKPDELHWLPEPQREGAGVGPVTYSREAVQVAWSPDGHRIAATNGDDTVRLWDLRVDAEPTVLPNVGPIRTMAFSEDGTRLATGGDDGTTYIWNIRDRTGPIALRGHQRDVWHAAFTPDGRRLISSDSDGVVRIWNTDGTGSPLVLDEFRAPTRTVATLPGERYVTAHDDGTIWVWRCQACAPVEEVVAEAGRNSTRELTAEERRIYLPES